MQKEKCKQTVVSIFFSSAVSFFFFFLITAIFSCSTAFMCIQQLSVDKRWRVGHEQSQDTVRCVRLSYHGNSECKSNSFLQAVICKRPNTLSLCLSVTRGPTLTTKAHPVCACVIACILNLAYKYVLEMILCQGEIPCASEWTCCSPSDRGPVVNIEKSAGSRATEWREV